MLLQIKAIKNKLLNQVQEFHHQVLQKKKKGLKEYLVAANKKDGNLN
jgi:hypothetical protein